MFYFRYTLLFLALVLFTFASIGYSQENTDQFDIEPSIWESMFWTVLIVLVILAIFTVFVFFVIQMVRQWKTMWKTTQALQTDTNQVKLELTQRLDAIQKISMGNTKKLNEIEPTQASIQKDQKNIQFDIGQIREYLNNIGDYLENMNSDRKIEDDNDGIHYRLEVEKAIQSAEKQVSTLVEAYENGEPMDLVGTENPTPSQNVLMILNWIAGSIEEWINDLEQSGTADSDLIQSLGFAYQVIKDKLKGIRGSAPPLPEPLDTDTVVSTDAAYNEFKNKCAAYVSRNEGLLIGYQLGREIDETEYNQFIPQFIKDRLFNSVARYLSFEKLPKQLDELLELIGYEVVPIEIGKTAADARVHEIQGSRQATVESGAIVEVILPGLRRKADGETIQKPVVIRGE